jgi:hypothetical protein
MHRSITGWAASGRRFHPPRPPVIQINGDNPAIIEVRAAYTDLGATITGPQADLNLGITTYVNGTPMNPLQIDTSTVATDTIAYATTTLLAPLKKPSALPGMPWRPSVISTWPSGLNLTTTPPLPFRIPLSAAQTLPSLST